MTLTKPSFFTAITSSWALFLGFGVLMLGDGLQNTLLAVRASLEGFPTAVTGLIMSTFYVGFLGGSILTPRIVERVGHIRVFGALASLASAAVLVHGVLVVPVTWGALRLVSGFCLAGLYVVAESWLNDRATNETRGQVLSVYMVITYIGVGGGQLLLNASSPRGYELFILTSVLISLALVPLLLSAGPAPKFTTQWNVRARELYAISPLAVVGTLGTGMAGGALFGMGPVYADSAGLSIAEISLFMTAVVLGAIMLQWPIGHLSDRHDRRQVLIAVTLLAAILATIAIPVMAHESIAATLIVVALFGGLSIPLYSLCIAHANDFLEPEQIVAASGGLVLVSGLGAIVGPVTVSLAMATLGPSGFFWGLAFIHFLIGVFGVYRVIRRRGKPVDEQGPYAPTTPRCSQVAVEWSQHTVLDRLDEEDT